MRLKSAAIRPLVPSNPKASIAGHAKATVPLWLGAFEVRNFLESEEERLAMKGKAVRILGEKAGRDRLSARPTP